MLKFIRHNRLVNFVLAIGLSIIMLNALEVLFESGIFDDLAGAFGWFVVMLVLVFWGEELMDAVDDALQPRKTFAYAVITALPPMTAVFITLLNPADTLVAQVGTGAMALFGVFVWADYLKGADFRDQMYRRRRRPRTGLSRFIPV